jgi:hypothetical protein
MVMIDETARVNVERLITLTETLTGQIGADADAFEARRPHEAAGRMEETARLANLFRHESARVKQNPALIAGAPREARARLAKASQAFERELARHGRALYAVKEVTEGVVRAIANEVAVSRAASSGYGPGARASAYDATAITLNRSA